MGEGIAADIIAGLYGFAEWLFGGGDAITVSFLTAGDGAAPVSNTTTAGAVSHKILENTNRRLPAFTISNHGGSAIRYGQRGQANCLLEGGASYTFRWKNPVKSNLVINDLGVSGIEINITS